MVDVHGGLGCRGRGLVVGPSSVEQRAPLLDCVGGAANFAAAAIVGAAAITGADVATVGVEAFQLHGFAEPAGADALSIV